MRLAAIDIGSNAMRLLINDVIELNGKPHFVKLGLFKVPVRLGWDVFNDGKISDHNIQRLTSALQAYKNFVDAYKWTLRAGNFRYARRKQFKEIIT